VIDNSYLEDRTFKESIVKWGEIPQMDMLVEECAELIIAIEHYKRGRVDHIKVAEELADVYMMVQQISIIMGLPSVEQWLKEKHTRTKRRLRDLPDYPE
jgi:NTP pyrophosphatase (non-canonical NTP hydrolase)